MAFYLPLYSLRKCPAREVSGDSHAAGALSPTIKPHASLESTAPSTISDDPLPAVGADIARAQCPLVHPVLKSAAVGAASKAAIAHSTRLHHYTASRWIFPASRVRQTNACRVDKKMSGNLHFRGFPDGMNFGRDYGLSTSPSARLPGIGCRLLLPPLLLGTKSGIGGLIRRK